MLRIKLSRTARQYISSQANYYKNVKQSPVVAKAFREEVKKAFNTIQKTPRGFQASHRFQDVRVYPENRFNTYIYYSIEEDFIRIIDIRGQAQSNN